MKVLVYVLSLVSLILLNSKNYAQSVELGYLENKSATYEQTIKFYSDIAKNHEEVSLLTYGKTDIGKPLNLFVISTDGDFDPRSIRKKNKRILLINNAIHPGEPCGVDACIKLVKELLEDSDISTRLKNLVICIVPMYNIGGALNRGCCSRANQNGPVEYGFRGNAKNLDLNRDFIKADSRNAKGFAMLYNEWNPDVFIDTHTSNGADYQYVMTLITTQLDKLHPKLASFVREEMNPVLYKNMKTKGFEMTPYVMSIGKTPESGIMDFLETPRYSTGYTTLFNTIGYTTEAHMFKPFEDRVMGTYHFINSVIEFIQRHHMEIGEVRAEAVNLTKTQKSFDVAWSLDTSQYEMISFKGYESAMKPSAISGNERLYYDRNKSYTKEIKYYNRYEASISIDKPLMYIVPQGWEGVIQRLRMNGVSMRRLAEDMDIEVEVYMIDGYESVERPYEGHYLHKKVQVHTETQMIKYYAGDFVIKTDQVRNRYLVETLEPQGVDSYFAWGFFDPILQQKEWFSSYVFEEKAEEILLENPNIKRELDKKVKNDTSFTNNGRAQLQFIYERSPYYEKSRNRYPVARIMKTANLKLR